MLDEITRSPAGHDRSSSTAPVLVRGARKAYGDVQALDGVDLDLRQNEVLGVLGPNGAGKTTLLESIAGLRRLDSGVVEIDGEELGRRSEARHRLVSLQPQQSALFQMLTVRETVQLWCSFYDDPVSPEQLVDDVGLRDKADRRVKGLSGGQLQRLRLALAFAGRTPVVMLDEPTGSLDPQGRQQVWDAVGARAGTGSVLLSTHSMEEAQLLCDRIVLIDHGRVVASGTPHDLVDAYGGNPAVVAASDQKVSVTDLAGLSGASSVSVQPRGRGTSIEVRTTTPQLTMNAMNARAGLRLRDVRVRPPSLQDVFLALTGRHLEGPQAVDPDTGETDSTTRRD